MADYQSGYSPAGKPAWGAGNRASYDGGEGGGAPPAPPDGAPSLLTATATGYTTILLAWTDNSTNEVSFIIERSPDGVAGWVVVGSTSNTSYQNSGLLPATEYFYRVRATNAGGNSAASNTDSATTDAVSAGGYRITQAGDRRITQAGDPRVTQVGGP